MPRSSGKARPTQADVARLAGVSQASVSYVLTGGAGVSIPLRTRRRILDAVDELGYIPDGTARSLRTQRTSTIAGVIPDITNPFYPAFERGIQEVAESRGYDLIVYNTDGVREKEQRCLRSVQQRRVEGVVAVLFHATVRDLRALLEQAVAVVRLEPGGPGRKTLTLPLDSLYVDNEAASRAAVGYLIGRGHQRIGLLSGSRGPGEPRMRGYRRAHEDAGIPVDDDLIRDGGFTGAGGQLAMRELLRLPSRPTAVFAANDMMALGALVALRADGLRIPDDVALVGFDDTPTTRLVTPALTTVSQFQEQLGRRAAEMLFERLDGNAPEQGRYEQMPYELLVRESA